MNVYVLADADTEEGVILKGVYSTVELAQREVDRLERQEYDEKRTNYIKRTGTTRVCDCSNAVTLAQYLVERHGDGGCTRTKDYPERKPVTWHQHGDVWMSSGSRWEIFEQEVQTA